MTNVSNKHQANYGNAIGTAVVGGTLWGTGQYLFNKKPFVDKNGNIKDTFIKNMEEALVGIKDTSTLEIIDIQKGIEKEIDALKTHENLKEFVSNRKNDFARISDDEIKIINEEISKMEVNDGKNFVKRIFKTDGKYSKHYKETLASCYDDMGKLAHNTSKMSKEKFESLKKVINKGRRESALRAGATFMAVCAACCCFFEFWSSKRN